MGYLLHFFHNFEIRILCADAILYFQVVLYIREMPPYELLLKIFLCDPPRPKITEPNITQLRKDEYHTDRTHS